MTDDELIESARNSLPRKKSVLLSSPTVCATCFNPVYISERVLFNKKLYHRSCFRCFNCNNLLNSHTTEVSPNGILCCLEILCHLELQKRSHNKSLNANSSTDRSDVSDPISGDDVSEASAREQESSLTINEPISSSTTKIEITNDDQEKENDDKEN